MPKKAIKKTQKTGAAKSARVRTKSATVKTARGASKQKAAAPPMDHDAMMAAWQKAATPAADHRRLEPMIGAWDVKTTLTMAPGAPPSVSTGTSEQRWALGGRYLEQRYQGDMMGMPFEGLGYTGFDNVRGKYVGNWMDSFGTGIMNSAGIGKPKDDAIEFESESMDPAGKPVQYWSKILIQDRNHHSYEMWTKAPNGRRYRTMLIEYTRR